jgi:hypothetical protein
MSDRQINIPLSKIVTVRIRCRNKPCNTIIESNVDQVKQKFRHGKCPVCQAQLFNPTNNCFDLLGQALASLAANGKQMEVAFVYVEDDLSLLS